MGINEDEDFDIFQPRPQKFQQQKKSQKKKIPLRYKTDRY